MPTATRCASRSAARQAGDIAELDVARVQTEVASTESDALALDRQRAQVEHALAVLVGDSASSFGVRPDEWATALPAIPPGVPGTVLTRRPDVSAAQNAACSRHRPAWAWRRPRGSRTSR
jgi:multidrug efflux system outer membrane protein